MPADVIAELLTPDYAADVYGVVIVGDAIDEAATDARRKVLGQTGSFRVAYLSHYGQAIGIAESDRKF